VLQVEGEWTAARWCGVLTDRPAHLLRRTRSWQALVSSLACFVIVIVAGRITVRARPPRVRVGAKGGAAGFLWVSTCESWREVVVGVLSARR
jgi:hypothetical protein